MVKRKLKKVPANNTSKNVSSRSKEFYWILAIMAVIIVVLLLIPYIAKEINTFKYKGLVFTKERFGQIPVYHYYYTHSDRSGVPYQYNLYLRIDPRENIVPVTGKIEYPEEGSLVYLSFDSNTLGNCENVLREIHSISDFLNSNFFKIRPGNTNRTIAEQMNITYVTCDSKPNNMVLMIVPGNETKITKDEMCYTLSVNNCNLLSAIEKFETQSIIDAKSRV